MRTILSLALTATLLLSSVRAAAQEAGAENAEGQESAEAAAATAAPATRPADAPVKDQQSQVVEGAPLGNANVNVHIVEKKPYTNAGRHELVLYPAVAQVNSKFTVHMGAAAMYSYH
ncbi:MAG: outer membrane beta-barrel domain-containing protein, partial [Myxococcales bacterium]